MDIEARFAMILCPLLKTHTLFQSMNWTQWESKASIKTEKDLQGTGLTPSLHTLNDLQ
jgi:hypothetical protein